MSFISKQLITCLILNILFVLCYNICTILMILLLELYCVDVLLEYYNAFGSTRALYSECSIREYTFDIPYVSIDMTLC